MNQQGNAELVDGSGFSRRARLFITELQANNHPNARWLAEKSGCAYNTAMRTIQRLQEEYLAPIDYNPSRKGYFLRNKHYTLPAMLPPGKDELAALLLVCSLLDPLQARDLQQNLGALWDRYASTNPILSRDLEPLTRVFSCDLTSVAEIADAGVLKYVNDAAIGQDLRIIYESPWSGAGEKIFEGHIERVHFSDGTLYLCFLDKKPKRAVLNAAFIKNYERLDYKVEIPSTTAEGAPIGGAENWLAGFGVWSGEMQEIEFRILPPASRYHATQRWHETQQDSFEGDVLVRRFQAAVSPELIRRALSLGEFLGGLKPQSFAARVRDQLQKMISEL